MGKAWGLLLLAASYGLGCQPAAEENFDRHFTADGDNQSRCDAILTEAFALYEQSQPLVAEFNEKVQAINELAAGFDALTDEVLIDVTQQAISTLDARLRVLDGQLRSNAQARQALGNEASTLGCSWGDGGTGGRGPFANLV